MASSRKVFWLTPDEMAGFHCPSRSTYGKPSYCHRCPALLEYHGMEACRHIYAPRYEAVFATVRYDPPPVQRAESLYCCPQGDLKPGYSKCPVCGGNWKSPADLAEDNEAAELPWRGL